MKSLDCVPSEQLKLLFFKQEKLLFGISLSLVCPGHK